MHVSTVNLCTYPLFTNTLTDILCLRKTIISYHNKHSRCNLPNLHILYPEIKPITCLKPIIQNKHLHITSAIYIKQINLFGNCVTLKPKKKCMFRNNLQDKVSIKTYHVSSKTIVPFKVITILFCNI